MDIPLTLETKAFLLSVGSAAVDPSLIPPTRKSTAGPGAGTNGSVFFRSGEKRVRLTVSPDSPLSVRALDETENGNQKVAAIYENEIVATGFLEKPGAHCPKQAYINISEKCIYDCKYCSVPKIAGKTKTKEEVLRIAAEVWESEPFEAVSLTSGVAVSPEQELENVLAVLPELRKYNVPIGVSVYPVKDASARLKKAGVSEIKYNLESPDKKIFEKVCPGLSYADIMNALRDAVSHFGKGNVFTNMIVGLGETDDAVRERLEELAEAGVIADIRPIAENPLRKGECLMERPDAERLLVLYAIQAEIYRKYGLRPDLSKTMCAKCGGCDLVCFTDGEKTDTGDGE